MSLWTWQLFSRSPPRQWHGPNRIPDNHSGMQNVNATTSDRVGRSWSILWPGHKSCELWLYTVLKYVFAMLTMHHKNSLNNYIIIWHCGGVAIIATNVRHCVWSLIITLRFSNTQRTRPLLSVAFSSSLLIPFTMISLSAALIRISLLAADARNSADTNGIGSESIVGAPDFRLVVSGLWASSLLLIRVLGLEGW